MSAYFWFPAGILTGFAATLVMQPLWRGAAASLAHRRVRIGAAVVGVSIFSGVAVSLYHVLGSPEMLGESRPLVSPHSADVSSSVTNTTDVETLRVRAAQFRRERAFDKARDVFAQLEKLGGMTADTWADQADVLASLAGGSLRGAPAKSLEQALALDPGHPKALWLNASLAHEERRYADSLVVWRQLRAVLPAGSSDTDIIDANIAEAIRLAAGPAAITLPEVSGTVSLDSRFVGRVPAGATLFIYAKAADSAGPPLAVLRQEAGKWPVTFRLDDTLAMLPTRKLSQFEKVIVEARISVSGQAAPTAGDLLATSAVLKPADGKKLQLVIDREVG